jgi:hypothetical protein
MKADVLLGLLETTAEQLGVKVSYETLTTAVGNSGFGRGGLCRVKGQFRVIIDKRATSAERVTTLATALGGFDTTELKLAPAVREALDTYDSRASTRGHDPRTTRRAS